MRDDTSPVVDLDYCLERALNQGYKITRGLCNEETVRNPLRLSHITSTSAKEFVTSHLDASGCYPQTRFP